MMITVSTNHLTIALAADSGSLTDAELHGAARARAAGLLDHAESELAVTEFENATPEGSSDTWLVTKAGTTDGTRAVVLYVNKRTGDVVETQEFEAIAARTASALERISPEAAAALVAAGPTDEVTVAFSIHAGSRVEVEADAVSRLLAAGVIADLQEPPSEQVDGLVRDALRAAYKDHVAATLAPVVARLMAHGLRIEYQSRFVPIVFATGTAASIRAMASEPSVLRTDLSGLLRPALATAGGTDQATTWSHGEGFQGSGSRIAVVEYENVDWANSDLDNIPSTQRKTLSTGAVDPGGHPTWVMGAIASQTAGRVGIAPDAYFISSSTGGGSASEARDFKVLQAIDNAIDPILGNADVINLSLVQDFQSGSTALRAYIDEVVRSSLVHVSASGGNDNHCNTNSGVEQVDVIRSPGSAWNVITVGGIDDKNTSAWGGSSPDTVWTGHCFIDPAGGTFKPEISAPSVCVVVAGVSCADADGTSIAVPQVAGALGLIIGQSPAELRNYPLRTKAILIASSFVHRTAYPGLQVNQPIHDREGLGSLTTKWANLVTERRIYNGAPFGGHDIYTTSAPLSGGCYVTPPSRFVTVPAGAGRKVRFVAVWGSHGYYSAGSSFGPDDTYSDARLTDIDVRVRDKNGALIDSSFSTLHTVEAVEWTQDSTRAPYTVEIDAYSWNCSVASEKIAWAWVGTSAP